MIRALRTALPLLLGAAALTAAPSAHAADTAFAATTFRATHNSYSGDVDGAKHSITYQLDHGVRFVEFDIHDNDYASTHDYAIGHDAPGDLVDHTGGNPGSNRLRDWLDLVHTWSAAHPTHAPLVLMLDLKDDLTDNPTYAAGNLAALDAELADALGSRILRAADYPTGAGVDALRGRILPLLSGNATSRAGYRRDLGSTPAVALDGHGRIVEVHDSGAGVLWYWTGRYGSDGRVTWLRHGRYDTGRNPAVALNDSGRLVEVHQSPTANTLWSHVAQLDANGELTFSPSVRYDTGVTPTVAFTDPAGTTVREIHRSPSTTQNWTWTGVAGPNSVSWSGNATTSAPRPDPATAVRGPSTVRVRTAADGATPAGTLRYDTDRVTGGRIALPQTAFDEYQKGDPAELSQGALFYAAPATERDFITAGRRAGHSVRGWDFDSADLATDPLANYPATNTPYAAWYQNLVAGAPQ